MDTDKCTHRWNLIPLHVRVCAEGRRTITECNNCPAVKVEFEESPELVDLEVIIERVL